MISCLDDSDISLVTISEAWTLCVQSISHSEAWEIFLKWAFYITSLFKIFRRPSHWYGSRNQILSFKPNCFIEFIKYHIYIMYVCKGHYMIYISKEYFLCCLFSLLSPHFLTWNLQLSHVASFGTNYASSHVATLHVPFLCWTHCCTGLFRL